ncbi:hypothetical protein [Microbacterium indicum]|uniref:hypothetical protein n=1 Tax=Microbacterium indicum TaxID=358100 RepID=UPI0012EB16F2|nr:hypothetical protein [Microbacterium indicum]
MIKIVASRRTVIQGAVLATAYALVGPFGPPRLATATARADEPTAVIGASSFAEAKYYDSTWENEFVARFPVAIVLADRDHPLSLHATWDPRLFIVHSPAIGIIGESAREITIVQEESGRLTVDVDPGVGEIVLRVESINNYPNENLNAVIPAQVTLLDNRGNTADLLTVDPIVTPSAPWGIEAVVDWVARGTDVVPSRITVKNVGPNSAPNGLTFVAAYADVLAMPTVSLPEGAEHAPASIEERSSGGITEITIVTSDVLDAGKEVEILFPVDGSDSVPAAFTDFVPYVRLETVTEEVGMRATGRYVSYPVTDAGSQLSTYLSAPSAG